jgi:hypothetical protein
MVFSRVGFATLPLPRQAHNPLNLEATRPSATTGTLELAALRLDVGFLVLVRAHAKVPDGLTVALGSTKNQGVASSGGTEGKLVQGNSFTTSGENPGSGSCSEPKSSHGELRNGQKTVVIGNGAHNDNSALIVLCEIGHDARQRNRGPVNLRHEKASENNLVEGGIGTSRKEAVEFHQELEVDIVALGGTSMSALDVVTVEIDTCRVKPSSAIWFNACSKWAAWSGSADGASIARKRKISHLCFSLAHSG